MIYDMAHEILASLRTQGYPVVMVYGDQHDGLDMHEASLVLHVDRNRQSGDTPPGEVHGQGVRRNADTRYQRSVGAIATIYARSEVDGAMLHDHESPCDQIVDAFLTHLELWGRANRAGWIPVTSSRYMRRDEQGGLPEGGQWPGVKYEIVFSVPRAVSALDYTKNGRPTGTVTGFRNQTRVYPAATKPAAEPEPDLGCGG